MRLGIGSWSRTVVAGAVIAGCAVTGVLANTGGSGDTASFERFVAGFWSQARKAGISRETYRAAFRGVRPDPDILERNANQAEFKTPVWTYLDRRVTEERIAAGRAAGREVGDRIAAIEARYGVDRNILLAIWGMESNYGSHKGDKYVIRSLATLAYTGRRQKFGRQQLLAALKILQNGDIPVEYMTGSWAGAMGHTQFIPTTYEAYAVDWTGDGTRDIWRSTSDALASTANYLKRSGWQEGVPWGWEVKLPRGFDYSLVGTGTEKIVADWARLGVKPVRGGNFGAWAPESSIILPAGARGPAFLVTKNFRAILRYNNATAYALAVGHLADRIAGAPQIAARWPRDERPLSHSETQELQRLLNRRGYDTGGIDGRLGPRTLSAVRHVQGRLGLAPDGYPTTALLERLR
ncbi:lytic murein transglycosylase [Kaustia mangrovi]|uniref:Lytic murein transglycosylase n=1 Tax=Kaustia mangrovi TaxID=2593653 RepID=A0A7S8C2J7_9HYPH|nr:lytic murein transglycosylase [Kaustia mangrovi]QPC42201.1 lytic murein transglycosylase [Kaustia mangrovi]